jgi:predicted dehydrogenase
MNRRKFLSTTAAALAAPYVLPARVFGANERIRIGSIGIRNQGSGNLKKFMKAGCDVVGLCDVDSNVLNEAAKIAADGGQRPDQYRDYRKLLDRRDLDAVVVTTPDHWHALITINACQAGKDVYCEKPLSLTIAEGRRMVTAAREHRRVVQTGSQQRSSEEFWKACTLVRNGAIGTVHTVLVGIPDCNHPGALGPDANPPAELDYDMWLGPAPYRPYNEKRVHYNFRFWWDYSGGQMTNFGAHHLDIAQWGLGMDDSGPIAAEGTATYDAAGRYEVTESCRITYRYPGDVKVTVGQLQDDIPGGATFIGTEGTISVGRGRLESDPPELAARDVTGLPVQLSRSDDHTRNFLDCVRSREKPICDVEIGHRSATVCHLGNIVARLGRPIRWDPAAERMIGDDEGQGMTDREYRSPWRHDAKFART